MKLQSLMISNGILLILLRSTGMKAFHRLLIAIVLLAFTSTLVSAQEKTEPKTDAAHKLVEFHMALLKRGPKWTAAESAETTRLHEQHVNYVVSLLDSGKAVIAGPFTDGGDIDGVFVFRAKSADEA